LRSNQDQANTSQTPLYDYQISIIDFLINNRDLTPFSVLMGDTFFCSGVNFSVYLRSAKGPNFSSLDDRTPDAVY
jgi:hypothetical protein